MAVQQQPQPHVIAPPLLVVPPGRRLPKPTEATAAVVKQLVDGRAAGDRAAFLALLEGIDDVARSKEDVYIWAEGINALFNQLIDILAEHSANVFPADNDNFEPLVLSDQDALLACNCLRVLTLILEAASNRHYPEVQCTELLYQYLAADRMPVVEEALHLLACLGRHRKPKIADHDRRLVARLNSLSQGWGGDIHGFSLRECCTEPASVFGEKASHLYLEFYLSDAHLANMPNRPPNVQPGVVTVSKKDMYKDPRPFAVAFRQLREEYHVPPEFQYELAAFLTLSRSFYDLELRRSCIRIRLMAASTLVFSQSSVATKAVEVLFQADANLVNELAETIGHDQVPLDIKSAALRLVQALIQTQTRTSSLLSALGVSNYHGVLPTQLRLVADMVTNDAASLAANTAAATALAAAPLLQTRFCMTLLSVMQLVVAFEQGCAGIVNAGAVPVLMRLLDQERNSKYATRAARTLEGIIEVSTEVYDTLVSENLLGCVAGRLHREIVRSRATATSGSGEDGVAAAAAAEAASEAAPAGLSTPPSAAAPAADSTGRGDSEAMDVAADGEEDRGTLPADSKSIMKMLFRLLLGMVRRPAFATGFRVAVEGALLNDVCVVLSNIDLFGLTMWFYAASWVTDFVNAEPSLLAVVQDHGLQTAILTTVSREVPPSADIITFLPNLLAALALNEAGLAAFVAAKPLDALVPVFLSPKHLNAMSNDTAATLGASIDELWRHQPSLRPDGVRAICSLVDQLVAIANSENIEVVVGTDPNLRRAEKAEKAERERDEEQQRQLQQQQQQGGQQQGQQQQQTDAAAQPQQQQPQPSATSAAASATAPATADSAAAPTDTPAKEKVALYDYITNSCRFIESLLNSSQSSDHAQALRDAGLLEKLLALFRQKAAPSRMFLNSHARNVLLQAIDALLARTADSMPQVARMLLEAVRSSPLVERLLGTDAAPAQLTTLADVEEIFAAVNQLGGVVATLSLAAKARSSGQTGGSSGDNSAQRAFWESGDDAAAVLDILARFQQALAARQREIARIVIPRDMRQRHLQQFPVAQGPGMLPMRPAPGEHWGAEGLRVLRDLHTALGTARTALDVFYTSQLRAATRRPPPGFFSLASAAGERSNMLPLCKSLVALLKDAVAAVSKATSGAQANHTSGLSSCAASATLAQLSVATNLVRSQALASSSSGSTADGPAPDLTLMAAFVQAGGWPAVAEATSALLSLFAQPTGENFDANDTSVFPLAELPASSTSTMNKAGTAASGGRVPIATPRYGISTWNVAHDAVVDLHAFPLRRLDANVVHALSGGAWRCDICGDGQSGRWTWHSIGNNFDLCLTCFQRAAATPLQRAYDVALQEIFALLSVLLGAGLLRATDRVLGDNGSSSSGGNAGAIAAAKAAQYSPASLLEMRKQALELLGRLWTHGELSAAMPELVESISAAVHSALQGELYLCQEDQKRAAAAAAEAASGATAATGHGAASAGGDGDGGGDTSARYEALVDQARRLAQEMGLDESSAAPYMSAMTSILQQHQQQQQQRASSSSAAAAVGSSGRASGSASGSRGRGGRSGDASSRGPVVPDAGMVQVLVDMGFEEAMARRALIQTRNNVEAAADALLSNAVEPEPISTRPAATTPAASTSGAADTPAATTGAADTPAVATGAADTSTASVPAEPTATSTPSATPAPAAAAAAPAGAAAAAAAEVSASGDRPIPMESVEDEEDMLARAIALSLQDDGGNAGESGAGRAGGSGEGRTAVATVGGDAGAQQSATSAPSGDHHNDDDEDNDDEEEGDDEEDDDEDDDEEDGDEGEDMDQAEDGPPVVASGDLSSPFLPSDIMDSVLEHLGGYSEGQLPPLLRDLLNRERERERGGDNGGGSGGGDSGDGDNAKLKKQRADAAIQRQAARAAAHPAAKQIINHIFPLANQLSMRLDRAPNYIVRLILYIVNHEAELAREPPAADADSSNAAAPAPETQRDASQPPSIVRDLYARLHAVGESLMSTSEAFDLWQGYSAEVFTSTLRFILLLIPHTPAHHIELGRQYDTPDLAVRLLGHALSALRPSVHQIGTVEATIAIPPWSTYLYIYLDTFSRHLRDAHRTAAVRARALADPRPHHWQVLTSSTSWSEPSWQDYEPADQLRLEAAFRASRSTMDLPASAENGNPGARVDFNTMTERRNGMTQERRVRRVPQTPTRDTDAAAAAAAVPAVQSEDQEMSVSASGGEERQTRPVEANASASGTEEAAAAAAAVPSSATPTVTPTTAGPGATTITAPSSLFNDSAVEPPSQLSQALRVRLAKLSVAWLNVTLDADMLNALLRTLVLLTRDNKMAVLVAQTGGLRALFELRHGDAFPGLHVAIILIIRHACEDQRTLQHLMEEEILTDSELAAQTFSLRKLVHNMRYAVARSEDAFVAAASNTLELLQPAALGEAPSATVAVKLGSRASQVDHVSAGMTAVLSELLRAIEYRLAHQGDPTSLSAPCLPVTNRDGGLLLAPTWSPPPPAPSLSPPVDPSFALPIFDLPRLLQVLSELVLSYPALAGVLCKQTVKVPSRSSGKSGENGAAATEKSGGGGGATTANHTPVGSAGPSSAQPTPSKSHHVSKTGAAEAGKAFHVANHAAGSAPSSVVRPSKASGGGAATTTTTATPARLPSTGGALPTPGPTASAPGASTTETNNNNSGSNINGVSMLDFLFRHVLMYESHTQYVAGSVGHRRANAAASQAQRVLWAVANCGQSAVEEAWVAAWKAAFLDAGKQPKRAVAYRQQRHLARFLGSVLPARHGTQQRTLSQCALKMELLNLLVDALKSRDINDPSFKDDAESVLQLLALLMRFAQKQHFTSRPAAGADAAGAADAEHGDADVSLDEDRLDAMLEDLFEEGTLEDALLHALAAGNALHHDEGDEELHEIDVDEEGEDDEDHEDDEEDDEYGDDDDEDEDGGEGDDDLHAIDVDELGPEAMEFLMDLQQAGHGDDEDLGDEEMEDEDGADDRDHHHHHQHHEGDHDMDDSALLEGGPGDRVMVVEAGPDGFPEFMDDDEESDEGDVDHDHGSESGDALGEGGASSSEEDDADDDAVDEDDYDDEGGEGIDDYDGEGDAEYMDSGHDDYDLDELEEMGDMGAGGFEHSGFDRANIGWPTRTGRGGRGGAGGAGGVAGGWSYLDYDDDADDLVEDDETMMDGGGFGGGGTGAGHRRLARSNAVRRPPRAPGSFLSGAAQLFSWGGGAGGAGGGAGAGGLSVAPPVAVGAGGAGGAPPTTAGDQYGEMVLSDVHPLVGISTRVEGGSLTANGAAGTAANSTRRLLGLQRRAGGGGTSRDDRALEALEHLLASGQLDHLRDGNRQADVHIYDSETHEQLIARVSDGGVSVELRGGRGGNAHIPSDRQSTTDRLRAEMHILEGGNRGLQDLAEVAQAIHDALSKQQEQREQKRRDEAANRSTAAATEAKSEESSAQQGADAAAGAAASGEAAQMDTRADDAPEVAAAAAATAVPETAAETATTAPASQRPPSPSESSAAGAAAGPGAASIVSEPDQSSTTAVAGGSSVTADDAGTATGASRGPSTEPSESAAVRTASAQQLATAGSTTVPADGEAVATAEQASGEAQTAAGSAVSSAAAAAPEATAAAAAPEAVAAAAAPEAAAAAAAASGSASEPAVVDFQDEFLAMLPPDIRAEVLRAQELVRADPALAEQALSSTNPEFLAALPPDIQREVLDQERRQIERAMRERGTLPAAGEGGAAGGDAATAASGPSDMDVASMIATLTPELRREILLENSDNQEFIAQLPLGLAQEAVALRDQAARAAQARGIFRDFAGGGGAGAPGGAGAAAGAGAVAGGAAGHRGAAGGRHVHPLLGSMYEDAERWFSGRGYGGSRLRRRARAGQAATGEDAEAGGGLMRRAGRRPVKDGMMLLDQDRVAVLLWILFTPYDVSTRLMYGVLRQLILHSKTRAFILSSLVAIASQVDEAQAFSGADANLPSQARLLCRRDEAGRLTLRCSPHTCFKMLNLLSDLAERAPTVGGWFVGDGKTPAGAVASPAPIWAKLLELASQDMPKDEQRKLINAASAATPRRRSMPSARGTRPALQLLLDTLGRSALSEPSLSSVLLRLLAAVTDMLPTPKRRWELLQAAKKEEEKKKQEEEEKKATKEEKKKAEEGGESKPMEQEESGTAAAAEPPAAAAAASTAAEPAAARAAPTAEEGAAAAAPAQPPATDAAVAKPKEADKDAATSALLKIPETPEVTEEQLARIVEMDSGGAVMAQGHVLNLRLLVAFSALPENLQRLLEVLQRTCEHYREQLRKDIEELAELLLSALPAKPPSADVDMADADGGSAGENEAQATILPGSFLTALNAMSSPSSSQNRLLRLLKLVGGLQKAGLVNCPALAPAADPSKPVEGERSAGAVAEGAPAAAAAAEGAPAAAAAPPEAAAAAAPAAAGESAAVDAPVRAAERAPAAAAAAATAGESAAAPATSEAEAGTTAPAEPAPAKYEPPRLPLHLDLDSLWDVIGISLQALSRAAHSEQIISALEPTIEAFLLCHQNVTAARRGLAAGAAAAASGATGGRPSLDTQEAAAAAAAAGGASADLISPRPLQRELSLGSAGLSTPALMLREEEGLSARDRRFLQFLESHRAVINELVRRSPEVLMSPPYSVLLRYPSALEFRVKEAFFRRKMRNSAQQRRGARVRLRIRRERIFEDSYQQLARFTADQLTGRIDVHFAGEEGIDAGGLLREWYYKLSHDMMNPNYALFCQSSPGSETYQPNQHSGINPDHLLYFRFCGRVVAKAIFDNQLLDCHFTRAFYKQILGTPVSWRDLAAVDESLYNGLLYILENDISTMGDVTFSADVERFGEVQTIDLKPNGRNILVTEKTKKEYVKLVAENKLTHAIRDQIEAFRKGFYEIIPQEDIAIFDEQELEMIISGLPEVDIDDLRANTLYLTYTANSPQVQWFWRAVRSMDREERVKLVQFVTGTGKIPVGGFAKLVGMSGPQKFTVQRDANGAHRLPQAHTCFNQLDLPEYESYEQLRAALLTAITEASEGFGFS